jgi:hypothetical protein
MSNEIDWKDESGLIAFVELEKRYKIRETTKKDIKKVIDFTPDDWILVLLHSSGSSLKRMPIFKLLCIFGERAGLNDIFSWYEYGCNAYSVTIENSLKDLVSSNKLELETMFNYKIRDQEKAEHLWNLLPESIKSVLLELREEFKDKGVNEINDYIKDAYPEYTIRVEYQEHKIMVEYDNMGSDRAIISLLM